MGRKNYPPREKKKRKVAAKTKLGQELIMGMKEILKEVKKRPEIPVAPWKKALLAAIKNRQAKVKKERGL